MILHIFAVKDRAADAFMRPIFSPSMGLAIRSFHDEINRASEDNSLYKHPDDYDLYHLGNWDDATGHFTQLPGPKQISIGKQLRNDNVQK